MATETRVPQFVVKPNGQHGHKVMFNGVEVGNVRRVSVSNDLDIDDVARSSITIDLVGEQVLVLNGD